jgi:itaconate CoA-transferase
MDAVPGLGQHTEQVLRELGLDTDRIELMRAAGAI